MTLSHWELLSHDLTMRLVILEQERRISLPYEVSFTGADGSPLGCYQVDSEHKFDIIDDASLIDSKFPVSVSISDGVNLITYDWTPPPLQ